MGTISIYAISSITFPGKIMHILPIPALQDNYIWLWLGASSAAQTRPCIIVDPGEAAPVIHVIEGQDLHPQAILLTHHHADHTAGVETLCQRYSMPVWGPAQDAISSVTHPLSGGESIEIMDRVLQTLFIPGHTHGHVAYYNTQVLFSGDTLFTAGCGRVFEGTMGQMYHSLQQLAALPENLLLYCGHEYTAANLVFAAAVEPENPEIQQRIRETAQLRAAGLPTVPSTLALEKATNPFLRCDNPAVKQSAEQQSGKPLDTPEAVFAALRNWKNRF
jgi:hydroxyacylglutathione hydrolase